MPFSQAKKRALPPSSWEHPSFSPDIPSMEGQGVFTGSTLPGLQRMSMLLKNIQQTVDQQYQLADLPFHHGRDGVEELRLLAHLAQQFDAGAKGGKGIAQLMRQSADQLLAAMLRLLLLLLP